MKTKHLLKYKCMTMLLTLSCSVLPIYAADPNDREAVRQEMIASNPLHEQQIALDTLLMPKKLYVLKGEQNAPSRLTLFYRNICLSPFTNYSLTTQSVYGMNLEGRWFYESNGSSFLEASTPFNLDFSLTTPTSIVNTRTQVEVVEQKNTEPIRLLAIGDSLTRMGDYLTQVQKVLKNTTTVGTITYPGETIAREGRGGWTLKKYFTLIGQTDTLDSPFVFPTTISGSQYKGNTLNWQKICAAHSLDSAYGGLQKLARGWKDTGDFLYDANGYYKYPAFGDVMVDPTLPEGQKWVQWNGVSWQPMPMQPTQFEFSFSKYMERFSLAYPQGSPTHVSILLGANDFGTFDTLMDLPGYLSYMQQLIDSIHAYDPTIKVIICTPTLGPNRTIMTEDRETYFKYDRNIKLATYYLLGAYDNDESIARNIYLAPLTQTLDTTNGYDYTRSQVEENGVLTTKVSAANTLHPNSYGHSQMGNALAAVLQKTRNDSIPNSGF